MGTVTEARYLVAWEGSFTVEEGQDPAEALGAVMDHLLATSELTDPSIELDSPTGVVFEAIVDGDDGTDAITRFSFLLQACLHAAGVATPRWATASDLHVASAATFRTGTSRTAPLPA